MAQHPVFDSVDLGSTDVRTRAIDRYKYAHDASHYLLVPDTVLVPHDAADVARIFRAARDAGRALTFRSGGTSLSGQGVSGDVMVDVRHHFRGVWIEDDGRVVRVQPGATVRNVNARLARHRTKLGPDPASEIACTIGGVIANNSSGMHCGTTQNSYRTIASMVLVLPSGTVIDTADADADDQLRQREPAMHAGLIALRDRLRSNPDSVETVAHQFSMKNTMGYGLNALLDFDAPIDMLQHLVIGSEGTLAFVAEARFQTVPAYSHVATGLLVFDTLRDAMAALPGLVDHGFATVELMDAESLRVAQTLRDVPEVIAQLDVDEHAALLVEVQSDSADELAALAASARDHAAQLPLSSSPDLTTDPAERASLWTVRKGLYTAIAGNRPSGTNALLEDIVVPVDNLLTTCERLTELFARHGYEASVIFGHAKDGNVHFMLNERFDDPASVARYERFTDDLVELVLAQRGSLKAEHGTGRIMAPFVRRQYGDELYAIMVELKRLIDPTDMLNPGVVLSDDPGSYMRHLKTAPTVEPEVDRCVECGYCEPTCPSRDLTTTPRQRIVLRREIEQARERGDLSLVAELTEQYDYDAVQTCAVDGMCGIACPVDINTGDLVRRLRNEQADAVSATAWKTAAKHWGAATQAGRAALTVAKVLPAPVVTGVTDAARAALGADTVPRYTADLPRGGTAPLTPSDSHSVPGTGNCAEQAIPQGRPAFGTTSSAPRTAEVVFFSSCVGTMFGPATPSRFRATNVERETTKVARHAASGEFCAEGAGGSCDENGGVRHAMVRLLEHAGIGMIVPRQAGSLCCGTPWKSKGYASGYAAMATRVIDSLLDASRGGAVPIVCDGASCTEGLLVMVDQMRASRPEVEALRIEDATQFVARDVLPLIEAGAQQLSTTHSRDEVDADSGSSATACYSPGTPARAKLRRIAVHPTCATEAIGATRALTTIAEAVADEAYVPVEWGCCAFAGDRGMLHPELTASATVPEAAEVQRCHADDPFDAFASANRPCEMAMSRATDKPYRHVLELLADRLDRP
ncbi:FAD-binding and (Fe-S)-binding domain-containing protein [Paramicrobacterium agarici]|uniref:FAD-binding and (Fe-S)-binding domain-containing protein n=1 Tax=Paramicrobacterium agarici TaxID=630514 RepID=UPI001154D702|nr:FAD-binding and (Fe-S)-binding domain-containing protein [Microbacterium agarici]TQO22836.1 D-lactate dehydrogenase [Microbacterium agarici]